VLVKLSCRMPVKLVGDDQTLPGFLDLSSGHFASDPTAPVGAQSYSWIGRQWLPVGPEMQSPDGKHYAYSGADGIHDVDLVSGVDGDVLSSPPGQLLLYATDGIYLSKNGGYAGHLGLWRLNPVTAALTQLLPETIAFDQLGGGAAWYIEPRSEGPSPSTLYRIEFGSATRHVWYSQPNTWVVHLGTDPAGRPLVGSADTRNLSQETLLVVPTAGTAIAIQSGAVETTPWFVALTDPHGLWFQSTSASAPLWLLRSDDQLITVARAAVRPLGSCN
jgi:hypothetical protein